VKGKVVSDLREKPGQSIGSSKPQSAGLCSLQRWNLEAFPHGTSLLDGCRCSRFLLHWELRVAMTKLDPRRRVSSCCHRERISGSSPPGSSPTTVRSLSPRTLRSFIHLAELTRCQNLARRSARRLPTATARFSPNDRNSNSLAKTEKRNDNR
jgi:hypothetical protein